MSQEITPDLVGPFTRKEDLRSSSFIGTRDSLSAVTKISIIDKDASDD